MNNVRRLREERGLRQDELGKAVFLAASAVSAVENGRRGLTEDAIQRLCAFFGVSADYLLGRSELRKPPPDITAAELRLIEGYRAADQRCRAIAELALFPAPESE